MASASVSKKHDELLPASQVNGEEQVKEGSRRAQVLTPKATATEVGHRVLITQEEEDLIYDHPMNIY